MPRTRTLKDLMSLLIVNSINNECFFTDQEIADKLGASKFSVSRKLKEFEKEGRIKRITSKPNNVRVIRILFHVDWKRMHMISVPGIEKIEHHNGIIISFTKPVNHIPELAKFVYEKNGHTFDSMVRFPGDAYRMEIEFVTRSVTIRKTGFALSIQWD